MYFTKQAFTQKLSNNFKSALLFFMQHFKQFSLITCTLFISFFSFDDVSHFKSASAAFSFASKTIFMERMTTHEVDRREVEAILTLNAIITQESL